MVSVGRSCGCIKQEKDPTPKQKHRPTAKQKCHWLKETELGSNDTKGEKKEKKGKKGDFRRREKSLHAECSAALERSCGCLSMTTLSDPGGTQESCEHCKKHFQLI